MFNRISHAQLDETLLLFNAAKKITGCIKHCCAWRIYTVHVGVCSRFEVLD